jgi:hypothetical protein
MEAMLGQVADAINNAPDGHIIAGSECQVREVQASGETLRKLIEADRGKKQMPQMTQMPTHTSGHLAPPPKCAVPVSETQSPDLAPPRVSEGRQGG